jgi:iron complex transport system substrate-binding protein
MLKPLKWMLTMLTAQPFVIPASAAIVLALSAPRALPVPVRQATIVEDMNGRRVPLQTPAKRVVMFTPTLWDYLTLDPDIGHMTAITNYLHTEVRASLLAHIYPAVVDIPTLVTRGWNTAIPGDPEDVIRRHPDVVFSWGWFADGLKQAGLPVVDVVSNLNKPAEEVDIDRWRMISSVAGADNKFPHLLLSYRQRMKDATAKAHAARKYSAEGSPTALYLDVRKSGLIHAEAGKSFYAMALTAAGATNAAQQPRPGTINIEQLMVWDPQTIILSCYGNNSFPRTLFDDERFSTLTAVKEKRVYKAPCGVSRMEGLVEAPLFIDWLSEIFYPDQRPKSFRSKFAATYREFYGYEISDAEIDKTIWLNENSSSSGFDRFARR